MWGSIILNGYVSKLLINGEIFFSMIGGENVGKQTVIPSPLSNYPPGKTDPSFLLTRTILSPTFSVYIYGKDGHFFLIFIIPGNRTSYSFRLALVSQNFFFPTPSIPSTQQLEAHSRFPPLIRTSRSPDRAGEHGVLFSGRGVGEGESDFEREAGIVGGRGREKGGVRGIEEGGMEEGMRRGKGEKRG